MTTESPVLGNVNRARNDTYRHSGDFRVRTRGCPYHEPASGESSR